jgi:hypothetical protein
VNHIGVTVVVVNKLTIIFMGFSRPTTILGLKLQEVCMQNFISGDVLKINKNCNLLHTFINHAADIYFGPIINKLIFN